MTHTALRRALSEDMKGDVLTPPPGVVYRRRGKTILLSPSSAKAKPLALQPNNTASMPKSLAIRKSVALTAGTAGAQSSLLLSVPTAAALGILQSTPEVAASSLIPEGGDNGSSVSCTAVAVVEPIAKSYKPRAKRKKNTDVPLQLFEVKFLTVAQTTMRYPAFTQRAIRHLVAQGEAYKKFPKAGLKSNGFAPCILRPAGKRKVLIDAEKFELWLSSPAAQ